METIVQKRVKNGWQSGKMYGRVENMDGKVKHKMVRCENGWQGKKMAGRVRNCWQGENWMAGCKIGLQCGHFSLSKT